ncbi:MAG TPA: quinone oxidoreductase [Thiolinea sp.]|nr:quinone oxidoreductase [Thiolinea sp.]
MSENAQVVRIHTPGGPEVMQLEQLSIPAPAAHEVQVKHTAIGLNFIDTYHRSGLYPVPLPSGIGLEAAGVITAVGNNVTHLKPGDRIAYGAGPIGAYASLRNIPASRVSKLPDTISDETAAAMMLKGMTVRYLLKQTYPVKAGETVLYHAAAGGVGLIFCQWARALGATVIGTVGSEEKAEIARAHGCTHVINYRSEDVAKRVRELTDGKGVPVVYDGVGQATLEGSLDSLQPRGLLVSFGNASGPIHNFDPGVLSAKGSLYLTRPTLMTYVAADADLQANTADLFDIVASKQVSIPVHQRYALSEVQQAHRDLEGRKTTGTTLLLP